LEITPFAMSSHSSIFFLYGTVSPDSTGNKTFVGPLHFMGTKFRSPPICPVPLLPFFRTSYVYCLASYIYVLFIVENGRRDCAIVWLHVSDSWKMK
jgi:hypothetical protein